MTLDATGVVIVAAGGAIGATARYAVGRLARRSLLIVNVVGSLVLGAVLAASVGENIALAAGVGVCGSFTTFSSFALETVQRAEERPIDAAGYAIGTLVASIGAFLLGGYLAAVVPA
ncbi:CrcB family protein [Halopenitus sp. H-Gu1]|uniref:fluoride efflux transporter FluC n=1 Tax=Halopenitus sp. H-Gu1 TaxID=3242697 RepID=UPI00359F0FAF